MKKLVVLFSMFGLVPAFAQVGGRSVYPFLDVPASARIAAMGGTFITVRDHDLNAALQAPSLLNPDMDNSIAFNAVNLVGGVKLGEIGRAHV